jgi:multicomponent Na+:H+ antiporter subunit B
MSRRVRLAFFLPALAVFAGLLGWALLGLPAFGRYQGPYGFVLNRVALPERHVTNVVTAIVFDYRGFDTMGEEFILFAAVTGAVLLLRAAEREQRGGRGEEVGIDAVRIVGVLAVGAGVLVGLWLVAFGFVTPGGGFQGGVALASGVLLLYLASSYRTWSGLADPRVLEPLEGVGAGGFVIIGLAALVSGLPFLANLLGPGDPGTLWSGGSAQFVNWAVGLEVAAANLLLFREFLEEYSVRLEDGGR